MADTVRIALIGPESTGKSSIASRLATHLGVALVEEYAREYLVKINRPYNLNDVLLMYRHQFELERHALAKGFPAIVVDTEFINGKVWCEERFNDSPAWFTEMTNEFPYDLYLLTSPDLPWVVDPLRENPEKGTYFFNRYKKELDFFKLNYSVVEGAGEQRFESAIRAVSAFMSA